MNLFDWAKLNRETESLPGLPIGTPTALHADGYRWTSDGYAVWRAGDLVGDLSLAERHVEGALKLAFIDPATLGTPEDDPAYWVPVEVRGERLVWAAGHTRLPERHRPLFRLGTIRGLVVPAVVGMMGGDPLLYRVEAGGQAVAVVMGVFPAEERPPKAEAAPVRRIEEGPEREGVWTRGDFPGVMTLSTVSKWLHIGVTAYGTVIDDGCTVFPSASWAFYGLMQSVVHEAWWRVSGLGSTMCDRPRYSKVFSSTMAFPRPFEDGRLEILGYAGRDYCRWFAACQRRLGLGATKLHNRLADPREACPWVLRLRWLRWQLDLAALRAYNWDDLLPPCRTDVPASPGVRGTYPAVLDEIVGRLRELNRWRSRQL